MGKKKKKGHQKKINPSGKDKKSSNSPYNVNGYVVRKLGGSGKMRLKWGSMGKRRKEKPPPFTSLLQAVDESDYVPHSSGEIRTSRVTSESHSEHRGHYRRPRRRGD